MIILRCATALHAHYEWQANAVMAKNTGLTEQEIAAAGTDGPVMGINPEYALICTATDELSLKATLSDATPTELLTRYDEVLCRKYVKMIS